MIKKLRTSLLLPAELTETVNAYLKSIEEAQLDNSFINRILGMLKDDLDNLNQAITAVRINKLVDDVAEADAIRDDLFIGFRDLVDAYKRRRNSALIDAYEKVWDVIARAGTRLYAHGYTEQSGKLEALFAELDKPEYQGALDMLNAHGIYNELKQAQSNFTSIYDQRLKAETEMNYPTLKEAKRKIVPHVNTLIDAIGVLDETEPGKYTDLVENMNAITSQIVSSSRARKTRSESTEELAA